MTNLLTTLSEFMENIFPSSNNSTTPEVQVEITEPTKKVYGELGRPVFIPDPKGLDLELTTSSHIKEALLRVARRHTGEKVKIDKFLNSDEATWFFPKWLRSYYQHYISGLFDYFTINHTLFEVITSYILVIYVVLLVVLFIKKLVFPYRPVFMRSNGFVGNVYWYVKDTQIYGKFKIFYILNFCFFIGACFLLIYVSYYTFELIYMLEQSFYFTRVDYYPPVFNGNQHYVRHSEYLWSKKYFYNQANIPRKHFLEMFYYPHKTILTHPRIYSGRELFLMEEHDDLYLTSYLVPRPYYSKIDRMLSTCPSPFWNSFHILPYEKSSNGNPRSFVPY